MFIFMSEDRKCLMYHAPDDFTWQNSYYKLNKEQAKDVCALMHGWKIKPFQISRVNSPCDESPRIIFPSFYSGKTKEIHTNSTLHEMCSKYQEVHGKNPNFMVWLNGGWAQDTETERNMKLIHSEHFTEKIAISNMRPGLVNELLNNYIEQ